MADDAVIYRLNLIIVLLIAVLVVLLRPALLQVLFGLGVALFCGLLLVFLWNFVRA